MESVALMARVRGTGEWVEVEHVGWAPSGAEAQLRFDVAAGPHLRMVGRGPALFAEDQRVLEAFAGAARTAYEGIQLSGRAAAAQTLADVDRQRTALLAAVGHDLRTPLAGIKAAVGTLRQTDVEWSDAEREELLATIEDSSDRLDGVVRNLLDASRLQAGALTVQTDAVALDEVVSAAILALPEAAGRVAVDVPEDLPLVSGDRGLLHRVLVNVIENALRHGASTEPIEVSATAGGAAARIEIADHGRGVEPERAAQMFEPFQRLGDHDGGVGLGLAVARGFVEAMGGAMVADETPGGGLTMRIRLELARLRPPRRSPMTRVLVVDDEPGLLRALGINLRARGYEVDLAADGTTALALASRELPDAVVLDLGLPDIDGVEVIEGLRGWTEAPIIVLSARTEEQDKVVALDCGADDYVVKPFGMDELLARLRAALRRRPANEDRPGRDPGLQRRPGGKAGRRARRRAHPPDADRVARARALGPQRGQARRSAPAAQGGLGPGLRDRDQLPPRVHGAAATEARARSVPPAVLDH